MIGIGINPNVFLAKVGRSDKKALELYFSDAETATEEVNPFEMLQQQGVSAGNQDTKLMIFPPLVSQKAEYTLEKKRELVSLDIMGAKDQMTQILEQFMTTDKIKLDLFRNTGIQTAADYNDMILDNNVLVQIFDNMVSDFIELVQPFVGKPEPRFRLKLLRQSKEKAFATLPKRFLKDSPFIEPMSVPEEQSRVKFSKYEIKEGLDNADPVSKEAAGDKPEEAAPTSAVSMFGSR